MKMMNFVAGSKHGMPLTLVRNFRSRSSIRVRKIWLASTVNKFKNEQSNSRTFWGLNLSAFVVASTSAFLAYRNELFCFTDAEESCTGCESLSADTSLKENPAKENYADFWKETLQKAGKAVVSIHMNLPKPFDTQGPGVSQATGFVVDAEQGLILSNRHVVGTGPIVAEALFQNGECVSIKAVYRDPVHDFGFFKFDPKDVKHLEIESIALCPEEAEVGMDIRVVGNNAGEKLTISSGTLARLDRQAPKYGNIGYNDFNTFYYQCASSTTGGSSGSPILNVKGNAVALNAAGITGASNAFYLPLFRVKRAFDLLKQKQTVTRGTLQSTFQFVAFDELQRLGLTLEQESEIRLNTEKGHPLGMLVCDSTVPEGPADAAGISPGDILWQVNGKHVNDFVELEAIIDDSISPSDEGCNEVKIQVVRGGKIFSYSVPVADLHAITPSMYYETGGSIFQDLSYHDARIHGVPVKNVGVYIATPGYMLRTAGIYARTIITEVNGIPTPDLTSFHKIYSRFKHGEEIIMKVSRLSNVKQTSLIPVRVDKKWFPEILAIRDDENGIWKKTHHILNDMQVSDIADTNNQRDKTAPSRGFFPPGSNAAEKKLSHSLVGVRFHVPYRIDGLPSDGYIGTGLVIDAENGYIIVDRDTVPCALGDVTLSFGSSVQVAGEIHYIHPLHNLAVIKYDPQVVSHLAIKACEFDETPIKDLLNKKQWFVGLLGYDSHCGASLLSLSGTLIEMPKIKHTFPSVPYFRDTQIDPLMLRGSQTKVNGVYCSEDGLVNAYVVSNPYTGVSRNTQVKGSIWCGLPVKLLKQIMEPIKEGKIPKFRSLGANLEYVGFLRARQLGLDEKKMEEIAQKCESWPPVVLMVSSRWGGCAAERLLENGDIIIEIDHTSVNDFFSVEELVKDKLTVDVKVLRNGKILSFEIETVNLDHDITDRVVLWAGATLQKLPSAVTQQKGISSDKGGIYISSISRGSPAQKYKLQPTYRIIEVDGKSTLTLCDFLQAIKNKEDGSPVRLKTVDLLGKVSVTTLRTDLQYYPTYDMRLEDIDKIKKDRCVLETISPDTSAAGGENPQSGGKTQTISKSDNANGQFSDKAWKRISVT